MGAANEGYLRWSEGSRPECPRLGWSAQGSEELAEAQLL